MYKTIPKGICRNRRQAFYLAAICSNISMLVRHEPLDKYMSVKHILDCTPKSENPGQTLSNGSEKYRLEICKVKEIKY